MAIKSKTQILSDEEVQGLASQLRHVLPNGAGEVIEQYGISAEDTIRMISLASHFQEGRTRAELTLKEVSKKLKVPQYRIRAVEEGRQREILPKVLREYSGLLGLDEWCVKWARANKVLGEQLGIFEWGREGRRLTGQDSNLTSR